jgi:hypothetical protein
MNDPTWIPPTEAQLQAAGETVDAIIASLQDTGGVHAETAVSAAARMAGTFLFRSFNFSQLDAEPGTAVLSEEANVQGPLLIQTLGAGLNVFGVALDSSEMKSGFPEENNPQLSVTATQELLEARLRAIASGHGLTGPQAAHACALAAAKLIEMTSGVLDPHVGFSLAAFGFVEGSKTMPAPL